MSIEYKAYIVKESVTSDIIEQILQTTKITIKNAERLDKGYEVIECIPDIGINIFLHENIYKNESNDHPGHSADSELLMKPLCYEQFIIFTLDKFFESIEEQYRIMYSFLFQLSKKIICPMLFTGPGGGDIFYFADQKYYFEEKNVSFLEENYFELLKRINYCECKEKM